MISLGLVGFGKHVRETLLPSLQMFDEASVVAACDPVLNRFRSLSSGIEIFDRWEAMLERAELDGVIVGATPQVNMDVIRESHRRGLPIFVEKPLCRDGIEGNELLLRMDSGLHLGVGHNFSYAPAFVNVFSKLERASSFPVMMASLEYMTSKPVGDRWGLDDPIRAMLLTNATHALDLLLMYDGSLSLDGAACSRSGSRIAISVQLVTSGGALFNLIVSNGAPHFSFRLRVLGNQGQSALVDCLRQCELEIPRPGQRVIEVWKSSELQSVLELAGYRQELALFCESIGDETARHRVLAHSRRAVKCMILIDEIIAAVS
ncbi:Gfo/Idh/MocA family oxidoreductase [Buchananella felis]|uniref:Gfo/Idh/MocA family protein n=1 Tax=Buchananella felis TaxID=3231492 RepID=UPI00352711C0